MDRRRRFVPRPEGLEVRELMAVAWTPAAQVRPVTAQATKQPAWERRIERLPAFLFSTNPKRFVPPELVTALQNDLRAIATRLTPPPSWALRQFNLQLRATIPHPVLRTEDAAGLNHLFGLVLEKSGADDVVVARFQTNMKALAQVDSAQRNPAQTAAADYGMILQMCMGAGLLRPNTPKPGRATAR